MLPGTYLCDDLIVFTRQELQLNADLSEVRLDACAMSAYAIKALR